MLFLLVKVLEVRFRLQVRFLEVHEQLESRKEWNDFVNLI